MLKTEISGFKKLVKLKAIKTKEFPPCEIDIKIVYQVGQKKCPEIYDLIIL